jgi:hypothetical protein
MAAPGPVHRHLGAEEDAGDAVLRRMIGQMSAAPFLLRPDQSADAARQARTAMLA